ncbi:MAG: RNA-binding S4 domain-containing protein [Gammaproteobacteria bacterium]|nr:RNA-binding S4 domain-containing protein [Gammaproteobacteria bacterium]MCF6231057.1 RNA-binding S4 domain-containing protein [Gammaproteobacteria bacterium]
MTENKIAEKVRIDKWLWAARFYKTRALATEAINGGKIAISNQRCKPSRSLKSGEQVTISKGPYKIIVDVIELSDKRGPAKVATLLYNETEESSVKRQQLAEQLKIERASTISHEGKGRPSKRKRRQIIQFTTKNSGQ